MQVRLQAMRQRLARRLGEGVAAVLLVVALAWGASSGASAEVLQGIVVAVQDGDTLTLLDEDKTQHRIRLAGIDAPEKRQPFGQRSKEGLSGLVYRHTISVEWHKHDRYGRVVGKVLLAGKDVNLAQVEAGLAWHYVAYAREQAPTDRALYSQAEVRAREAHLGLWRELGPGLHGNTGNRSVKTRTDFPALSFYT